MRNADGLNKPMKRCSISNQSGNVVNQKPLQWDIISNLSEVHHQKEHK